MSEVEAAEKAYAKIVKQTRTYVYIMYISMYICMHICMYIYIYMYVYIYIYMYICMYICMYRSLCIWKHV